MIFILGDVGEIIGLLYRERYPDRRHQTHMVLCNCFQRARQGQFVRSRTQRGSSETVQLTVLAVVNTNISIRKISRIHGILRHCITDIKEFSLSSYSSGSY